METETVIAAALATIFDLFDMVARECKTIAAACLEEGERATRLARGMDAAADRRHFEIVAAEMRGGADVAERIADTLSKVSSTRRAANGL